eukprot:TRINITY_DN9907_c0_g1_i1.p1 TRINITY_DN9907_c0_g1~~TRINITY_DN9907_c0_g1_i1.p1  ORF type:complete len:124 (+),score=32.78 TRINITY_DN9907_c0_g1_i1:69-440(+)
MLTRNILTLGSRFSRIAQSKNLLGKAKADDDEVTNIEAVRRRVQSKKKLQEFEEKLLAPSRDKLIQQAYRELEEEERLRKLGIQGSEAQQQIQQGEMMKKAADNRAQAHAEAQKEWNNKKRRR